MCYDCNQVEKYCSTGNSVFGQVRSAETHVSPGSLVKVLSSRFSLNRCLLFTSSYHVCGRSDSSVGQSNPARLWVQIPLVAEGFQLHITFLCHPPIVLI